MEQNELLARAINNMTILRDRARIEAEMIDVELDKTMSSDYKQFLLKGYKEDLAEFEITYCNPDKKDLLYALHISSKLIELQNNSVTSFSNLFGFDLSEYNEFIKEDNLTVFTVYALQKLMSITTSVEQCKDHEFWKNYFDESEKTYIYCPTCGKLLK